MCEMMYVKYSNTYTHTYIYCSINETNVRKCKEFTRRVARPSRQSVLLTRTLRILVRTSKIYEKTINVVYGVAHGRSWSLTSSAQLYMNRFTFSQG